MPMHQENLHEVYDESDDEDDEEKRTLFCANLDERVTEDLLYEVFLQAGPIESARIPKDQNGRQRTFGFITYVHKCTLPYAVQLYQGLSLFRKTLTIKCNLQPSPTGNYNSPGYNNKRSSYDNSSLRGGNCSYNYDSPPQNPFKSVNSPDYPVGSSKHQDNISLRGGNSSYNYDSPPQNPFKSVNSPDYPVGSSKHQDNISKHASSQRRPHINASPYQRNSTGNEDRHRERNRDHKRRHYNNGSNRHSDQRSVGKQRR